MPSVQPITIIFADRLHFYSHLTPLVDLPGIGSIASLGKKPRAFFWDQLQGINFTAVYPPRRHDIDQFSGISNDKATGHLIIEV